MKTLILGGGRSGKSRLAEAIAQRSGHRVVYIATATAWDEEMRTRIAAHRALRPAHWTVCEEPHALAKTLNESADDQSTIVVDCLTLWLTNLLIHSDASLYTRERRALLQLAPMLPGEIIFVSNETNLGVIPADALSRRFCDEAGTLHQELALVCERVVVTMAGLPLVLKGTPL